MSRLAITIETIDLNQLNERGHNNILPMEITVSEEQMRSLPVVKEYPYKKYYGLREENINGAPAKCVGVRYIRNDAGRLLIDSEAIIDALKSGTVVDFYFCKDNKWSRDSATSSYVLDHRHFIQFPNNRHFAIDDIWCQKGFRQMTEEEYGTVLEEQKATPKQKYYKMVN